MSHRGDDRFKRRLSVRYLTDFPAHEKQPIAIGSIEEIAGFVCLPVHRLIIHRDNRAGFGLLRISATVRGASSLYHPVRSSVLVGVPDLRFQPYGILGRARDPRRGARP